jgi:nicotinamidase-related amidase
VTTLFVAGVHTSGVVLSTVRDAADHGYQLILLSDCISDPDAELHRMLMERIFPRQAEIITVAGLDALLAGAAA